MEKQQEIQKGVSSVVMITHDSDNLSRKEIRRKSVESLFETVDSSNEIIVFNNKEGSLGWARNTAIKNSIGEYLVICDDDILFKDGWLEECIKMVEMGDKFMATPVPQIRIKKWERDRFMGYRRNDRTGSNCMVMRRKDFEEVGWFDEKLGFKEVGGKYANRIFKAGFSFLITKEPMAIDMGFKKHSYETNG